MEAIQRYITELQGTFENLPLDLIEEVIIMLNEARLEGNQIFIMGNGGSASTASHFVCDLSKNTRKDGLPPFKVIGLADNMASLTAYANDEGFENVFAQQLANLVRPRDVVIGISTSGNSPNVLRAIHLANEMGARTVAFTGFNGGKLGQLVNINVCVPSNSVEQIEDVHLMLEHLICRSIRETQPAYIKLMAPRLFSSIRREYAGQFEMHEQLRHILQLTLNGIGASSGSIVVLNGEGQVVDGALAYSGEIHELAAQQFVEIVEQGLAGWVVENRQAALISNTNNDPRWLRRSWESNMAQPRSAISVPLMEKDRVVGVLTLVQSKAEKFTPSDLALLTSMAVCISIMKYSSDVQEPPAAA